MTGGRRRVVGRRNSCLSPSERFHASRPRRPCPRLPMGVQLHPRAGVGSGHTAVVRGCTRHLARIFGANISRWEREVSHGCTQDWQCEERGARRPRRGGQDLARGGHAPPFRQDRPPGRPRRHQAHARLRRRRGQARVLDLDRHRPDRLEGRTHQRARRPLLSRFHRRCLRGHECVRDRPVRGRCRRGPAAHHRQALVRRRGPAPRPRRVRQSRGQGERRLRYVPRHAARTLWHALGRRHAALGHWRGFQRHHRPRSHEGPSLRRHQADRDRDPRGVPRCRRGRA